MGISKYSYIGWHFNCDKPKTKKVESKVKVNCSIHGEIKYTKFCPDCGNSTTPIIVEEEDYGGLWDGIGDILYSDGYSGIWSSDMGHGRVGLGDEFISLDEIKKGIGTKEAFLIKHEKELQILKHYFDIVGVECGYFCHYF